MLNSVGAPERGSIATLGASLQAAASSIAAATSSLSSSARRRYPIYPEFGIEPIGDGRRRDRRGLSGRR